MESIKENIYSDNLDLLQSIQNPTEPKQPNFTTNQHALYESTHLTDHATEENHYFYTFNKQLRTTILPKHH